MNMHLRHIAPRRHVMRADILSVCFTVAIFAAVLLLLTGCASGPDKVAKYRAQEAAYRVHAAQVRSVPTLDVQGSNICWSITGATRITLSQPIDALPQMDREPTGGEVAVDIIEAIVPIAPFAAIYGVAASGGRTTRESRSSNTYIETLVAPETAVAE